MSDRDDRAMRYVVPPLGGKSPYYSSELTQSLRTSLSAAMKERDLSEIREVQSNLLLTAIIKQAGGSISLAADPLMGDVSTIYTQYNSNTGIVEVWIEDEREGDNTATDGVSRMPG